MSLTADDHLRLAARYGSWLADNIAESFDVDTTTETSNSAINALAGVVFHLYESQDHGVNNFGEPHDPLETVAAVQAGLILLIAPLFEGITEPHIAIGQPGEQ